MLRAVKVVRREDFEYERTFEREFEGIQRYEQVSQDHPGLVDVLHVGRDDEAGFYYYVMELADDESGASEEIDPSSYRAKTLTSELRNRSGRAVEDCVHIGISLAGALGHLHLAGLTHRDVKPSNIIFVKGVPKLADVGLVAATGQRTFVGTEGYVPPEGPGTNSADLYSLAMVLYEMHTGKDRMDFPELPTNLEIPPTVNRDEWRALNSVICRAGSPDPSKRYDSAHSLALALRGVIASNIPGAGKKSRAGVGILVTLLILALLGGVGFGGYWLWKDTQSFVDENSDLFVSQEEGDKPDTENGDPGEPVLIDPAEDAENPDEVEGVSKTSEPENPVEGEEGDPGEESADSDPTREGDSDDQMAVSSAEDTTGEPAEADTAETEPEEDSQAPIIPTLVTGQLKIMSKPTGATVWIEGEEVARTETSPLEFPVGSLEIVLKSAGYRDTKRLVNVSEGFQLVTVSLLPDLGPQPGQPWKNSLGIDFEPTAEGEFLMSSWVSTELFDQFNEETFLGIPRSAAQGAALMIVPDAVWKFCDWMTARDRASGFLGEDAYYSPVDLTSQIGGESLGGEIFRVQTDSRFGSFLINTEPPGAIVTLNRKRYGDPTPVTIEDVRLGPHDLLLELPGHAPQVVDKEKTVVSGPAAVPIFETLERDASVILGEPWTNSLGMPLVPLGDILVAQYETRVSDFREFVTASGMVPMPSSGFPQALNHPVTSVTVEAAEAFCQWLTLREREAGLIQSHLYYRLPTDLEWSLFAGEEIAEGATPEARGRSGSRNFPWGESWPPPAQAGNYADLAAVSTFGQYVIENYNDGFANTSAVGSFPPGPNGLHDLGGNVWEWVSDSYHDRGRQPGVLRGGGWDTHDRNMLLLSYRNPVPTSSPGNSYGFRFVLVPVGE